MLLQQLVEPDLPVGLQENTDVSVRRQGSRWRCRRCTAPADLGPVQVQLIVGDPPGLAVLQPLGSFLLHVVLLQAVRLDHLLEGRHASSKRTVSVTVTEFTHLEVWNHKLGIVTNIVNLLEFKTTLPVHHHVIAQPLHTREPQDHLEKRVGPLVFTARTSQ